MLAFLRSLLATIIGFFLSIMLIFLVILGIAAGSKKKTVVANNSVLCIEMNSDIPERPVDAPTIAGFPVVSEEDIPVSLKEILDNIRYAKNDSKIKGIYLEMDMFQAGLPTLQEIRNALIDFKKSGKFVYAYGELYTQKSYFVASVADSVFMNPNGVFTFAGFHSEQMFVHGLLDKLEVQPILIRGRDNKYKSAGEMFTRDSMSAPNRQQLTDFLNSTYNDYLNKISETRHVPVETLKNISDNMLVKFPQDAMKYKLVDKAYYKDQVLRALMARTDAKKLDDLHKIKIAEYNRAGHDNYSSGKKDIALIYAVGDINSGNGSENSIGSDKLSKAIREAREDDDVKAIVLRVNSPGGSALASDIIWREVLLAKTKKPVIASFGDVAASGGYYIAAPADMIYAQPNSITGSIGVFGLLPSMKMFWKDKLGINWDRVKTGKYADIGNPNRPMTKEEMDIIQTYIDTTYEQFKNRVSWGRKMPRSKVDSLAQGHVYSGIQAKELGLVDQLGNMEDAIAEAAKRANLSGYNLRIMPEYKAGYARVFRSMSESSMSESEKEMNKQFEKFKKIYAIQNMSGILMYYPYEINVY